MEVEEVGVEVHLRQEAVVEEPLLLSFLQREVVGDPEVVVVGDRYQRFRQLGLEVVVEERLQPVVEEDVLLQMMVLQEREEEVAEMSLLEEALLLMHLLPIVAYLSSYQFYWSASATFVSFLCFPCEFHSSLH